MHLWQPFVTTVECLLFVFNVRVVGTLRAEKWTIVTSLKQTVSRKRRDLINNKENKKFQLPLSCWERAESFFMCSFQVSVRRVCNSHMVWCQDSRQATAAETHEVPVNLRKVSRIWNRQIFGNALHKIFCSWSNRRWKKLWDN